MKLLEACFRKALWNLAESFAKQRIWGKRSFPNNRCKSSVFHNLIMMYSVTPFGFGWFLNLGLFLGLTYDLSVYVAPQMSKHYLKQCFIRYFNMQFSKNRHRFYSAWLSDQSSGNRNLFIFSAISSPVRRLCKPLRLLLVFLKSYFFNNLAATCFPIPSPV